MADPCKSELEKLFPRIAQEFMRRWRTPAFEPYCYKLIVDDRGSRKGFPASVFDEILFLYWLDMSLSNFDPRSSFASLDSSPR
jgi:hypothetical protein